MTTDRENGGNATIASIPADDTGEGLLRELNRFERLLNQDAASGRPTQYEVRVDGLPVIRRTDDPARFAGVLDEVALDSTKAVEVRLYQGDSQHNHRHIILLERNRAPRAAPDAQPLAGIEERFEARLREQRAAWEHGQLQREHEALKAEHEELRDYADEMEEELREYRAKRLFLGQIDLVEVGGALLEGFVRRNPHVLASVPGGEALAGALLATPPPPAAQQDAADATVTRKSAPKVSDAEMEFLQVVRRMQALMTEGQFVEALAVLDALCRHPSRIPATLACALRPATHDNDPQTQPQP